MKRLSELMALAMEQNRNPITSVRWFFEYDGECNSIRIQYFPNGWTKELQENKEFKQFDAYLNNTAAVDKACKFFEKHLTTLAS